MVIINTRLRFAMQSDPLPGAAKLRLTIPVQEMPAP
jgi:hypothetical protein